MHYYQHNIGDYRRDTIHLSLLEHGVYRQLLDCYYLSEMPIPTETEAVFRRLSARTDEERQAVQTILNEYFLLTPEGWAHGRCDKEIAAYQSRAKCARANGKLGGRPVKTKAVISGLSEETQDKANAVTQERKNAIIKESSAKPKAPVEGSRLPENWILPTEWRQWAAQPPRSLPATEIQRIAAHFKTYWLSRKGQAAYKKDWRATWRNWIEKNLPKNRRYPEKFNALAYVNGRVPEDDFEVIEHS